MGDDMFYKEGYRGHGGGRGNGGGGLYNIQYIEDPPAANQQAVKVRTTYLSEAQLNMSPSSYASALPKDIVAFQEVFADFDDSDSDANDTLSDAICDLKLKGLYLMERNDGKHRMGDLLIGAHTIYEKLKFPNRFGGPITEIGHPTVDAIFETIKANALHKGFYDWLDSIPEIPRLMMISSDPLMRMSMRKDSNISPSMVVAFIKGVKYLDAVSRKSYALELGSPIKRNGKVFDTTEMKTVYSGKGTAIWVAGGSPTTFYAGNHIKGQFHHSSFLAGGAVVCGGEIVAHNGKIRLLSAKTGHYKAQMADLVKAINLLSAAGIQPGSYRVLVWSMGRPVTPCPLASEVLTKSASFESWGNGKVQPKDWNF